MSLLANWLTAFRSALSELKIADIFTILGFVAAVVAAYFAYPTWRDSRRRPRLRLAIHAGQSTETSETSIVGDASRGQVVFGLVLHNDGDRDAQFWRISVRSRDQQTTVFLGHGRELVDRVAADPRVSDGRWIAELSTQNPADRVPARSALPFGDRFTLNFPRGRQVARIEADYRLDADRAETVTGILVFDLNWTSRVVNLSSRPQ